jgi:O-antigen ligase
VTIARPKTAAPVPPEPLEATPGPADTPVLRPRLLELGVGLLVVVVPLAFLPMSASEFVDVKLVLVLVACALLWAGGVRVDRTLAILAGAWVAAMALSAAAGVDPWISVLGVDSNAGGLILLGASASALVVGASLPRSLVERIPTWLFLATVPVALIGVMWRFAPEALRPLGSNLVFEGSTLGHPVFLSGMAAAGIAAAVGARLRRTAWFVAALVLITTALSLSTKRSGLLAVAVGLAIALVRSRPGRARTLLIGGVVLATLGGWTVASAFVPEDQALSGVQRFEELDSDSAAARVHTAEALLRAWKDRPLLGWGVGNTWPGYLTHASIEDVEVAHRGMADGHNLLLGAAVTTGVVGLVPLLGLIAVVSVRAARRERALGWAAGTAAALFVTHLLQPVHTSLTPLMFLLAGIAAGAVVRAGPRRVPARLGRAVVGVLLSAGLVLSTLVLASSVLEKWGQSYNSTWALRAAVSLAPGRIWPVQRLAVYRAQDAAMGDAGAEQEARELVRDLVGRHPLNPDARMVAVEVGLSMNDVGYAWRWLKRQIALFPSDVASLTEGGLEFLETGRRPGFEEFGQAAGADAETSSEGTEDDP